MVAVFIIFLIAILLKPLGALEPLRFGESLMLTIAYCRGYGDNLFYVAPLCQRLKYKPLSLTSEVKQ